MLDLKVFCFENIEKFIRDETFINNETNLPDLVMERIDLIAEDDISDLTDTLKETVGSPYNKSLSIKISKK